MGKNRNERIHSQAVNTLGIMVACRYGLENAISKVENAMENGIKFIANTDKMNEYDFFNTFLWYQENK